MPINSPLVELFSPQTGDALAATVRDRIQDEGAKLISASAGASLTPEQEKEVVEMLRALTSWFYGKIASSATIRDWRQNCQNAIDECLVALLNKLASPTPVRINVREILTMLFRGKPEKVTLDSFIGTCRRSLQALLDATILDIETERWHTGDSGTVVTADFRARTKNLATEWIPAWGKIVPIGSRKPQ